MKSFNSGRAITPTVKPGSLIPTAQGEQVFADTAIAEIGNSGIYLRPTCTPAGTSSTRLDSVD